MLKHAWLWLHCNVSICIGWRISSSEFFSSYDFQLALAVGNLLHETQGIELKMLPYISMGFPGDSMGKSLPAKQETQCWVEGSITKTGRSPGGGRGNPLQCSCWRIPRKEEPGQLQSMGSQRVEHDCSDWARKYISMYLSVCLSVCLSTYLLKIHTRLQAL